MLYVIHWYIDPGTRDEAYARFKKTGHNAPPEVKIVKALFTLHQNEGWLVVESDDHLPVGKWLHNWSDLCVYEVFPVVDEEGIRAIAYA